MVYVCRYIHILRIGTYGWRPVRVSLCRGEVTYELSHFYMYDDIRGVWPATTTTQRHNCGHEE